MKMEAALRAIANDRRLQILAWLKEPLGLFPPQVDGDLLKDGVCGLSIARKLKVTQPTASEHLKVLTQAGLIKGKRIKQWTFYKRDEAGHQTTKKTLSHEALDSGADTLSAVPGLVPALVRKLPALFSFTQQPFVHGTDPSRNRV